MAVIESTIEGRYQIITRIAAGGMGEVYRAHDAVLDREVAVKVLHPQFAGDRGFVDRFRREARAAAILNHPNIVGVYDWGSTDGTYFMVMEFVPGTNLRTLLTEYGRLEPAQVIEACLPVLSALEHAHGHGIVHRDIKPENILIARDGVVKVADFGLARAYADSYVSQAEGTVTGTVQYLAPEQIQGEPADPRTDLYALGVVMFELLTGEPPFTGETSVSIALQHISGRVPLPSSIAPGVPKALDLAVAGATDRDRTRRPPSARALAQELSRAAEDVAPAMPVAQLAGHIATAEVVPDERATTVTIPRAISPRAKRRRLFRFAVGFLAVLLALAAGVAAAWIYAVPHYTMIPSVRGLSTSAAEAKLRSVGLNPKIGAQQYDDTIGVGNIIYTKPPAGAKIRKRSVVVIIPSLGRQLLSVPDVGTLSEKDASDLLKGLGFIVKVKREYNDTVKLGFVIRQSPDPNTDLEKGATVTITVSRGHAPVVIPDVSGEKQDVAMASLETLGFKVTIKQDFSTTVKKGNVIGTDPPAKTSAPYGSGVSLIVSKGPKTFPMPDVVGMSTDAAKAELESLGLKVKVIHVQGFPTGTVLLQKPDAGTTVKQGDEVSIYD